MECLADRVGSRCNCRKFNQNDYFRSNETKILKLDKLINTKVEVQGD